MENCTVCFKKTTVILFTLFASLNLISQTYILNEDFSSASGTTPPTGWLNSTIGGETEDLWHFDNPGSKVVKYPMIGTFAIFDSEGISKNQVPENVILETPFFDDSALSKAKFIKDRQAAKSEILKLADQEAEFAKDLAKIEKDIATNKKLITKQQDFQTLQKEIIDGEVRKIGNKPFTGEEWLK